MGFFDKLALNRLKKQHELLMAQAMEAQRNGKMDKFAQLSHEAQELYKKIQEKEKK